MRREVVISSTIRDCPATRSVIIPLSFASVARRSPIWGKNVLTEALRESADRLPSLSATVNERRWPMALDASQECNLAARFSSSPSILINLGGTRWRR